MSDDNPRDVLSSEQLESDDENIQAIGENRYVVTFDETEAPSGIRDRGDSDSDPTHVGTAEGLAETDAAYSFEIRGKFETHTDDLSIETNDVSDAFDSLLYWYARNVADDAAPEEVINVLLANSEFDLGI